MKILLLLLSIQLIVLSCETKVSNETPEASAPPIVGTWKLLTGTLIEKGDTAVTDYTVNTSFVKIINNTHFAFLHHDLKKGKDSAAVFSSGGGTYSLKDSLYTEHLEYCTAREWEGHDFTFNIEIRNDTLVQSGVERIESAGVDRINIERYVRMGR